MSTMAMGRALLGLVLLLAEPAFVNAGSLQVIPVTSVLSGSHAVEAFTVKNTGSEPTVIQVELVRWTQDHGKDTFEPTHDVLATPPLFRIGPGESQVVRVGLRHAPAGSAELTYRMMLTEVPPPPSPGFRGVAVALRLSVPLFIQPQPSMAPVLDWHVMAGDGRPVSITVANGGKAHAKVNEWTLLGRDASPLAGDKSSRYVLAGQAATWTQDAARPVHPGDALMLEVHTEEGEKHIELTAQGDR
jgi:fimbrial chaperone protein